MTVSSSCHGDFWDTGIALLLLQEDYKDVAVPPEAGSLCSGADGFIPKLHLGPRQREIMESQTHLGRKIPLIPSNPTANPALPKPLLNPAQSRDKPHGVFMQQHQKNQCC